jgi:transcriptional regulator with XRE-family HTH domain
VPQKPSAPQPQAQLVFLTSAAALGTAIRAERLRRGLTERAAAENLHVSRRFLQDLERGKPGVRLDKTLQVMLGVGLVGVIVPAAALQNV